MDLRNLFSKISFDSKSKEQPTKKDAPSHWIKCPECSALMFFKEVEAQNNICPKCNFHMRIGAKRRIEILTDKDSFIEYDVELKPNDPLKFVDKTSYKKRVEEALKNTGRTSSVVSGEAKINEIPVQLVVFDFAYMGGSLGSVEGEKIVRAVNRAIEKQQGVIIISASGGARMQESTFALMQIAKTSVKLAQLAEAKLPYISLCTDPTTGGTTASYAMLGDINISEPGALIGFAGQRVIKQTIGADLPAGFQRAEFLLEKGSIDMVVNRSDMRQTLTHLLSMFKKEKIS